MLLHGEHRVVSSSRHYDSQGHKDSATHMREVSAAAGLLRLCEGLQLFNGTEMSWTATCSPIDALDVLFDNVCELLDFHGAVAVDTTVGGHLCVRQRQEW